MKIIKFIFQAVIVSVLSFITVFLLLVGIQSFIKSTSEDSIDQPTTSDQPNEKSNVQKETKSTTYTESPVQPERKPNISDIKYARALMSHPRSKITDIHVLNDYDGVIKTATDNINNGVGNKEDYELYNIWSDMNEYEQKNN